MEKECPFAVQSFFYPVDYFQCLESDPADLVEMLSNSSLNEDDNVSFRQQQQHQPLRELPRMNSLDSNYILASGGGGGSGTSSTRTATIRGRSALSGRPPIPVQMTRQAPPLANTGWYHTHNDFDSRPSVQSPISPSPGNFIFKNNPRDQYMASDDPVQRFTILLNYCIEDIERFCAHVRALSEDGDRIDDNLGPVAFNDEFPKNFPQKQQ